MIKGWLQTDTRLDPVVQTFGCALLCSCYIAPDTLFQPSDVNSMFEALKGVGFVDAECTILDWDKVVWSVSPKMRLKFKALEGYTCQPNEREILKFYLSNVKEDHFVVGDGKTHIEWDSMNRPDVMKEYATFVEKVVITVA